MSQENVKIVRQAYGTLRSDISAETIENTMALADPELELISRLASVEGTTYRGHDGLRVYREDLNDAFREWRNDLHEITEVGSNAVMTEGTFRATGHSGVDVELLSATLWTLSGGIVVKAHSYPSRHEALEAAGLTE